MKKLLISILIILLLVLCGFAVTKGYNIGGEAIKEKNEQLDESIGQATKLASTDYPKAISDTEADLKKLTQEKKNYEDMVTISTGDEVKQATQFQKYEIESLWVKIGNHAKSEGVVMKMDLLRGTGDDNYNLNFTVNGSYIGITNFISNIENDSQLGFKIENFSMVPSSSTTDLQATFTCKDITIKGISNSSSSVNQSTNNQNNNTTTNTNNTTSSNSTNTANSTTNSTNTNTANNTNTTNTLR